MQEFQQFIESWGYLGVFVGILATGLGVPMPEELPIVLGGVLTTHEEVRWYIMLPVCIVGVIIGDSFLYLIGRYWGTKLIDLPFVRKHLLTPEKFDSIAENFQKYGVKILLFARLTPGIRAPIFLTAGITKLPITHFLIADGIYAIPGVSILFFLGYWFTDAIVDLVKDAAPLKPILVLVALAGVIIYFVYHFWKKPVVTGNPTEMPPIVGPVTEKLENVAESVAEKVADKVMQRSPEDRKALEEAAKKKAEEEAAKKKAEEEAAKKKAEEEAAKQRAEEQPGNNGQLHPPDEDSKPAVPRDQATDGRQ
jgi:membrane protein DedA with SNARE-associated domain